MGNKGVKAKLDRSNSKFLGGDEKIQNKAYLTNFYNTEMKDLSSFQRFQIIQAIVDEKDLGDLIELPDSHENMSNQGGFLDSLTEEQAEKIYEALVAIQN